MNNKTYGHIDMDEIRTQYYNTPNITELRAAVIRARLEAFKMLKIYKEYVLNNDNAERVARYNAKWEKSMDKLKSRVDQMKRHGSTFTLSRDLVDCKLSEFFEKEKAKMGVFDSMNPYTKDGVEPSSALQETPIAKESSLNVMDLEDIHQHSQSSVHFDVENSPEQPQKERRQKKTKNILGPVIVSNKNNYKITLPSGNQLPLKNFIHKKTIMRRYWRPLPFKKPSSRTIGHNYYEVLDNMWKESSDGCIELLDTDQEDKAVIVISSEDEDSELESSLPSVSKKLITRKESSRPSMSKNSNPQIESSQVYKPIRSNSRNQDLQKLLVQTQSIADSVLIEINAFDLEANECLAQALLEQELNKKSLFDRRNYKLQRAIEKNKDLRADLPEDIDETALLMKYLVDKDLTLDSDDESPQPNVGQGVSLNQNHIQVDSHKREEMKKKFTQLRSFNFKCGSGDVNETALDYSNPEEPKIAIAYIANSDPNYNSMGNLQFCDVLNGSVYNLYGHLEEDAITKQDLWTTVTDVKFSPDGKLLFSASTDCSIKIWKTWDHQQSFQSPLNTKVCKSKVHRISVSQRPERGSLYQIASCEDSGMVQVHSIRKDNYGEYDTTSIECFDEKWKNDDLRRVSSDVVFGMDNNVISGYVGSRINRKGEIKVWDIKSRKRMCKSSISISSSVSCLDISHDGQWVACGTTACAGEVEGDGKMHMWDLRSKKTIIGTTEEKDANVISIAPNDQYVALGGISNTVHVFDRRNMKKSLHSLEHEDPNDGLPHDGIMSLQWIPDSSILLSGGNDSTVRVWNVDAAVNNSPLLYKFENHDSPVTSIRISPDLNFMLVGVSTGKVYVYTTNETYLKRGN
ncbi:14499_t:CDS:10, partial [Acaulospora morrowiae]